jgi:hypothetical protein
MYAYSLERQEALAEIRQDLDEMYMDEEEDLDAWLEAHVVPEPVEAVVQL